MYHAKEYNIRVMNLSIAAASTDSWQLDPLCRAVRSATAMGITVVVAAGNFGVNASGQEAYGTVSAPGNEPSAITVGSVNFKGTSGRTDDTVNNFSSRGPTRGGYVDTSGTRIVDNLIKPDLVAHGNKMIGAAATKASTSNWTWNALASSYYNDLVAATGVIETYRGSPTSAC